MSASDGMLSSAIHLRCTAAGVCWLYSHACIPSSTARLRHCAIPGKALSEWKPTLIGVASPPSESAECPFTQQLRGRCGAWYIASDRAAPTHPSDAPLPAMRVTPLHLPFSCTSQLRALNDAPLNAATTVPGPARMQQTPPSNPSSFMSEWL